MGDQDWVIAPVALASSALGLYLPNRADPITLAEVAALDRQNVNALDRGATYKWSRTWRDLSDWSTSILVGASGLISVAPLFLDGRLSDSVTMGALFAETYFLVTGMTGTTKALVGRIRPYAYNTSLTPDERGRDDAGVRGSFISGHTSLAFAAATLMSTIYTDVHGPSTASKIVWASSLSLAAITGYARVQGGMHFASDVVGGAAVGAVIGYLVPVLHRADANHPVSISAGPGAVQLRLSVGGR